MSNSSIEEEIREKGRLVYSNRGRSMLPLIREGKDVVVLVRPQGKLRKYDVPLYKPTPFTGKYVLHRIIQVRENDYVIRGDNCISKEYGITDADIVGVLSSVIRSGKEVKTTSFSYKFYSRLWVFLFPLRLCFAKAPALLRKALPVLLQRTSGLRRKGKNHCGRV